MKFTQHLERSKNNNLVKIVTDDGTVCRKRYYRLKYKVKFLPSYRFYHVQDVQISPS